MSEKRKIASNVLAFMDEAAEAYGKIQEEHFSQEIYCELLEKCLSSPIEDLFYIALKLQCASVFVAVNPDPDYDNRTGKVTRNPGLFVTPQAKIGSYRVDFLIEANGISGSATPVVVELDGHAFHDKDKHQRSYEKARDRFLVKSGYRVLHFTGSDVTTDPHKVVFEVLSMLDLPEYDVENYEAFDPNNRLGRPT